MLIAEELILLALDDAGNMPQNVRTSRSSAVVIGTALLAELALDGAVVSRKRIRQQPMLHAVPDRRPSSQPLREAYERVAEAPGTPLSLALPIGAGRFEQLAARLVSRGHLARQERAAFFAVPVTWPVADRERKDALQRRVMGELLSESVPEPRTGVLIAFMSVLNVVDQIPAPADTSPTALRRRAKAIAKDSWATPAVRAALRSVAGGAGNPPHGESPTQGFGGEGNAGW